MSNTPTDIREPWWSALGPRSFIKKYWRHNMLKNTGKQHRYFFLQNTMTRHGFILIHDIVKTNTNRMNIGANNTQIICSVNDIILLKSQTWTHQTSAREPFMKHAADNSHHWPVLNQKGASTSLTPFNVSFATIRAFRWGTEAKIASLIGPKRDIKDWYPIRSNGAGETLLLRGASVHELVVELIALTRSLAGWLGELVLFLINLTTKVKGVLGNVVSMVLLCCHMTGSDDVHSTLVGQCL